MGDKKNKKNISLHIITPVLLTAVCAGIIAAAAVKPSDKLKTYTNIAFMGSLGSDPYDDSDKNGLVIKDNDIDMGYRRRASGPGPTPWRTPGTCWWASGTWRAARRLSCSSATWTRFSRRARPRNAPSASTRRAWPTAPAFWI